MSIYLDQETISPETGRLGTRFLLYPQVPHLAGYEKPETVWISTSPNEIQPGPADRRMYVADPLFEKPVYEYPFQPPFTGEQHPPAEAGPDGHFDHLDPSSRQFVCAHVFASLRRVLDIWESYLGHEVVWHFSQTYERLEIIPFVSWNNAQSGYGYMEFGTELSDRETVYPYALNFDVIAHEFGHALIFAEMGTPVGGNANREYFGYHESVSDLIALISLLHFDSVLDRLLRSTRGNLLTMNELNRIAELSGDRQIRTASNDRKMSTVTDAVHDLSKPFTGAIFDTLVEIYHHNAVDGNLVDLPESISHDRLFELGHHEIELIGHRFADAFNAREFLLKSALANARDLMGSAIARSWSALNPDTLNYALAGAAIADQLDALGNSAAGDILMENLAWREILVRT
ncbi:hypothetical protein K1718_00685 [Roseibium porphyridii]|uniref:Peptidase M4 family protein n=1 Tax=Roseibium porphyridii TaxID=2866279 RepID=A0ABY8F337_9HYPH|nr:hypothetical protein [Roseibium sp. KMA01]WFE89902.1 hypothetical protein K1718_00685 [Roseibium sp. KMA01]